MNPASFEHDPVLASALEWHMRLRAAPEESDVAGHFEAWLAESPAHAAAYARAEEVWRLTGLVGPASAPRAQHRSQRRWHWGALVGAAAAAVVCFITAPGLWTLFRADFRTGVAETRELKLPDGTLMALGPSSAVDVRYTSGERRVVLLQGQTFFEVAPDANRPFGVLAGGIGIADIGTAFDVVLSDRDVKVSVQNGVVEVRGDERAVAGERLIVSREDGRTTRVSVAPAQVASWRKGRLIVENATVADVVAQLGPYHRGVVWIADEQLAARRITGTYDTADTDAVLESLVAPLGGEVRWITPFVAILSDR